MVPGRTVVSTKLESLVAVVDAAKREIRATTTTCRRCCYCTQSKSSVSIDLFFFPTHSFTLDRSLHTGVVHL